MGVRRTREGRGGFPHKGAIEVFRGRYLESTVMMFGLVVSEGKSSVDTEVARSCK